MAINAKWTDEASLNYLGTAWDNAVNSLRNSVGGANIPMKPYPTPDSPVAPAPQPQPQAAPLVAQTPPVGVAKPETPMAMQRLLDPNRPMPQPQPTAQPQPQTAVRTAAPAAAPAPDMSKYAFNAVEAQKFAEGGLRNVLKTPGPNMSRNLMQGEDGKMFVRETINGSSMAPVLREPEVAIDKFRTRTGWDKEGRPIYSTGAAELAAVNAGISDYNRGLTEGYKEQYNNWANTNGMMPLQEAQAANQMASAGLTSAQAREFPATASSLRAASDARAAVDSASANLSKTQATLNVPTLTGFDVLGAPMYETVPQVVDRATNKAIYNPALGLQRGALNSTLASLSEPSKASLVAKLGKNTDMDNPENLDLALRLAQTLLQEEQRGR